MTTDTPTTFQGFPPDAIQFLAELAENNTRDWFQPRKGDYERYLKRPMEELCVALDDQFRTRGIPLHAENVHASGGYFHLQPGEIYVGGGVWHPEPSWLRGFRDRIVADYDGFRAIVGAPAFVEAFGTVGDDGESLKRVPTGYPADHPAADLLRKKNVTFGRRLADDEAMSPELPRVIADAFEIATPLMRYLATV